MRLFTNKFRGHKVMLFLIACQLSMIGFAKEFSLGKVTYITRDDSSVAVKSIDLSTSGSSADTIVLDIPDKVAYDAIQYAVTAIGVGSGQGSVFTGTPTNKLTVLKIPSSIKDLYAGTFIGATSRVRVEFLPNKNIKQWPEGMFKGVVLNSLVLPEGVWTDIPKDFCRNATIETEIVLPSNCRSIGDYAFAQDDDGYHVVNHFQFNYGLETIGYKAFFNNSPICESRYSDADVLVLPPTVTSIGESSFEGMKGIYTIDLPASLKVIPKRAFARWKLARYSMVVPEGVERIEEEAFAENGNKRYVFPYDYYDITGVYNYYLPTTLKYVGPNAFSKAQLLQLIECNAPMPPATDGPINDNCSEVALWVPQTGFVYYMKEKNWSGFKLKEVSGTTMVTVSSNIKDGGKISGEGTYKVGKSFTLSATPSQGYSFVGWLRGGVLVSANKDLTLVASGETIDNVMAVFKKNDGSPSALPDAVYSHINVDDGGYISLNDIALRNGAELDPNWSFDFNVEYSDLFRVNVAYLKGEFVHAHPDKYAPAQVDYIGYGLVLEKCSDGTFKVHNGIRIPEDYEKFPLQTECDSAGNLIPSCTLKVHLPIINNNTGVRDTLDYTVDVYMPVADKPVLTRDFFSDEEALQIRNGGYYAYVAVKNLDTKNGFDVELSASKKDVSSGKLVVDNIIKHSYGPGKLTHDDEIFKDEENNSGLYWQANSRYVAFSSMLSGQMSGNSNYTFNLRARNYNDDGTPGDWIEQTVVKPYRTVDAKQLSYEMFYDYNQSKRIYLTDDVTYTDNKDWMAQTISWWYENPDRGCDDQRINELNAIVLKIKDYPDWWGKCDLYVEDPDNAESYKLAYSGVPKIKEGFDQIRIQFPQDGKSHKCYLYWQDVEFKRKIVFTDFAPQNYSKYRFQITSKGGGKDNIKDLYMVYETDDGEIKGRLIKNDEWRNNRYNAVIIDEAQGIKRVVSLADSVPLGTAHSVAIPSKSDKVYSLRQNQTFKNITVELKDMFAHYTRYNDGVTRMTVYGIANVNFKLQDATTGKRITEGISLNNVDGSVNGDGVVTVHFETDDEKPIINADGYIPYYFRNGLKFVGNKVDADGYVGYCDDNGNVTITLPMRRRQNDGARKRPFDIVNVYYRTPGIDSVKTEYKESIELPWQYTSYSGPDTKICYEGSFQPIKNDGYAKYDVPTLAITIVYYDTDYKIPDESYKANDMDKVLGSLGYLTLRSGSTNKKWKICPASKDELDVEFTPGRNAFYPGGVDAVGFNRFWGSKGFIHDDKYKYTFVTYAFFPKNNFVQPEKEEKIYASLPSGDEILVGTFKNLTEDVMYMSKDAETEAPMGEEHVGDLSKQVDLEKFNSAFRNFKIDAPENNESAGIKDLDIELPTQGVLLPFNVGVQRINNDIVVRGVVSYNFLPGGTVMDLMDKTDLASDIDKVFFDVQRAVEHDDTEYEREDRALGFSTAFVGVRGWLEGRLTKNDRGYYVPRASGMGIKTEASGFFNGRMPTPLFSAGFTLGGEMSTSVELAYPDTTGLSWAVNKNAKFFHDVVQHTTVALNTSFFVGAGIDIYIAKAVCGVKGSLSASFDSEIRYKPYLQGARKIYDAMEVKPSEGVPSSYLYSGSRLRASGKLKAYAEAKFLWYKTRAEFTIASFDKRKYDPENYTNPLWKADQEDGAPRTTSVLRSSVYKPLKLSAAPENTNILLRDIDTYAEPRYLFGGKDMAYYKMNANDMSNSHIMLKNGTEFNSGEGEPIITADVSSTDNKGIIAYEVSTAPADKINDMDIAPKYVGIKASINNGAGWSVPTLLTGANNANYTPRTAIDENGKAAVAWKGGEFVASDYMEKAGYVDGALYMKRYDGSKWGNDILLTPTVEGKSVSDYAMAMLDGKPYLLASYGIKSEKEGQTTVLASVGYGTDESPRFVVNSGVKASNPQLVSFDGKLYGAAIVAEGENDKGEDIEAKSEVHLYDFSTDGTLQDLGALGLNNRNVCDFRLVKSDKSMALIWRENTQVVDDKTSVITLTPSVYGALIRKSSDENGNTTYFLSCPQLIAKSENGLDISFYDAYLPDESSMTGAVTLYDSNTGGANVVESTNYFDNDYTIRYAGIDTKVDRGSDYGYYVVLFNEGKDVIDYVDMQLGDDGVKHTFNTAIYPGRDAVITDLASYSTDIENGLVPKITPHFNESALQSRTYEQATATTSKMLKINRRRENRRTKAMKSEPKIMLNVVDINVRPLSVTIEGNDKYYSVATDTVINVKDDGFKEFTETVPDKHTTVLLNVMNDSPISLKSGYRTNVSLYYDVNGLKPYEYAHGVEIPASEFAANGNVAVARILVGKVPESVMLYAVAHTVDASGNIVKDQDMTNNASPVHLEQNDLTDIPSGFEDVKIDKVIDQEVKFEVYNTDDGAIVKGLTPGTTLRVYDVVGALHHLYKVTSDEPHSVKLKGHGVYVFSAGRQSEKVIF